MLKLDFIQTPFADCREFDTPCSRILPTTMDVSEWAEEVRAIIQSNFTVEKDYVIKHLTICSSPPIRAGLNPTGKTLEVRDMLQAQFGVPFVIKWDGTN